MIQDDAPAFEKALDGLADAFSQRKPGTGSAKHWFRSLTGFPLPVVIRAIDAWVDTKGKMPAISEIRSMCLQVLAVDREQRRQREEGAYQKWTKEAPAGATKLGRETIAGLRQFLRDHPKQPPSKRWAREILQAHEQHTGLCYLDPVSGIGVPVGPQPVSELQLELSRAALAGPLAALQGASVREREPGEDWEEDDATTRG